VIEDGGGVGGVFYTMVLSVRGIHPGPCRP